MALKTRDSTRDRIAAVAATQQTSDPRHEIRTAPLRQRAAASFHPLVYFGQPFAALAHPFRGPMRGKPLSFRTGKMLQTAEPACGVSMRYLSP